MWFKNQQALSDSSAAPSDPTTVCLWLLPTSPQPHQHYTLPGRGRCEGRRAASVRTMEGQGEAQGDSSARVDGHTTEPKGKSELI